MAEFFNKNGCHICETVNNGSVTIRFGELFPDKTRKDQIIFEGNYFSVVPDDSPIVQDHLLIITKEHILSCAELSETYHNELTRLRKNIVDFLDSGKSPRTALFFEHGPSYSSELGETVSCGACGGTEHAHLHVVPIEEKEIIEPLSSLVQQISGITPQKIWGKELLKFRETAYLYLAQGEEERLFRVDEDASKNIPSQFLRAILGRYLGLQQQDWDVRYLHTFRRDIETQRIKKTLSTLRHFQGWVLNRT